LRRAFAFISSNRACHSRRTRAGAEQVIRRMTSALSNDPQAQVVFLHQRGRQAAVDAPLTLAKGNAAAAAAPTAKSGAPTPSSGGCVVLAVSLVALVGSALALLFA
jgi:hypothetical protein